MCQCHTRELTFDAMLADPLIRLVMASDGVTGAAFVALMQWARDATAPAGSRRIRRDEMKQPRTSAPRSWPPAKPC